MKQTILGRRQIAKKYGVTENTIRWLEDVKKIKPGKVKMGSIWFMTYGKKEQDIVENYTSFKPNTDG